MIKKLLIGALVLCSLNVWTQNVTLRGRAVDYIGQQGAILVVEDFVSERRTVIAPFEVSETGQIQLELDLNHTAVIDVQINGVVGRMIVEPGHEYEFAVPGLKGKQGRTLSANRVDLEFGRQADNINLWIAQYNGEFETFFSQHAPDIAVAQYGQTSGYTRSRRARLSDTGLIPAEKEDTSKVVRPNFMDIVERFEDQTLKRHNLHMDNEFFHDYIRYSLAFAKLSAGFPKEELFNEYIENREPKVANPEYCNFINGFYGNYFQSHAFAKRDIEILRAVNVSRKAYELDSVLSDHPYWSYGPARRVAIMSNLFYIYFQPSWDKTGIAATLEDCASSELFGKLQPVANNVLAEIRRGEKGYQVEDYRFVNYNSEVFTNATYEGKYVYYFFTTSWCRSCVAEMKALDKLMVKYKNQVEFVLVSLDEDYLTYVEFVQSHTDFPGDILYGLTDPLVYEKFDVRTVPECVLISPDGKKIFDYTRKPSEGISLDLDKLVNRRPTGNAAGGRK
ncbi:MAG: TlpA family protein disulfide reductase [Flavobacteriales bacterium]|nr:TlpA family protein disulfide reductase [Flavobacteriales bacterium]